MPAYRKILVPVDFSDASRRALEAACDLARTYDAALTVFHVLQMPSFLLPEGMIVASPETISELFDQAARGLEGEQAHARSLGVNRVETSTGEGLPFREI